MDVSQVNDLLKQYGDELAWVLTIGLVALIAFLVLRRSLQQRFHDSPRLLLILRKVNLALLALIVAAGLRLILVQVNLPDDDWNDFTSHALDIAIIVTLAWLIGECIFAIEGFLLVRFVKNHDSTDVKVRKLNTQVRLISHLSVTVVIVLAIAAILMTFPEVRIIGQSMLASAGVLSVVAGLAAKTSLSNLFAGVQLTLSDSIRVGDIIQVGSSSGTVDEITLTYVVIDQWNERRLIIPSEYFLANSFQNWTRWGNEVSALFLVDVDWTVPVDELEAELLSALKASSLWDGRSFKYRIYGIQNGVLSLRIIVSASDTPNMFLLEALVNKTIVDFLKGQPQGQGLPRTRTEGVGIVPIRLSTVTDSQAEPAAQSVLDVSPPIYTGPAGPVPETPPRASAPAAPEDPATGTPASSTGA